MQKKFFVTKGKRINLHHDKTKKKRRIFILLWVFKITGDKTIFGNY